MTTAKKPLTGAAGIKYMMAVMILLVGVAFSGSAFAVLPSEILDDPALEARARAISKDIRCLVCQNQPIDDSDAALAADLRVLIRERLVAGDTDDEVKQFLIDRYGDYVLLTPPFKATTVALWIGPAFFLLLAFWAAFSFYRRGNAQPEAAGAPLSGEDLKRLEAIMSEAPAGEDKS